MSEQQANQQPSRGSMESLAQAYFEMQQLYAETDSLRHSDAIKDRQIAVLERENEGLRQQLKREKAQRDHFMRAYTALASYLDGIRMEVGNAMGGITASIERALEMSRTHAYGERLPDPERQQSSPPQDGGKPVPSFLTRKPTDGTPRRNGDNPIAIDLDAMRHAMQGDTPATRSPR